MRAILKKLQPVFRGVYQWIREGKQLYFSPRERRVWLMQDVPNRIVFACLLVAVGIAAVFATGVALLRHLLDGTPFVSGWFPDLLLIIAAILGLIGLRLLKAPIRRRKQS